MQQRVFIVCLGQLVEGRLHGSIGLLPQRHVIQIHVGQRAAAVIGAVVDIDHRQILLEQLNGRQDAIAMQAIGVQAIGMEVGGGHKPYTIGKQGIQQAMQNHRVGDVGHMKLIKTDELIALRHALPQHIQRVLNALQLPKLAVHFAHELVEMQAGFALNGDCVKKQIHQKTLAAPHPTKHVDAFGHLRLVDEFFQRIGTLLLVTRPVLCTTLKLRHSTQLGWVRRKTALFERGLVGS